ncbi:hypothetical protein [Neptunomonas japonica]|uniref:hypothetical protein n=1 Tax=Neptunomonas japonica TaxID=417574 RepID=UPI000421BFDC|nr:hypothetical protein [Neptunomonas japonica]
MSINLHIETLVLDGIDIQAHQTQTLSAALTAALETKLREQLPCQASTETLLPFTSNPYIKTYPISINRSQNASSIGERVGDAVYWGIRK